MSLRTPIDDYLSQEKAQPRRGCEHPGCCAEGAYPAPKSRAQPRHYLWFCLEHVRAYNAQWNYYRGMSMDEIYEAQDFAAKGERLTKPFKDFRRHPLLYQLLQKNIAFFATMGRRSVHQESRYAQVVLTRQQHKALAVLELTWPCEPEVVKRRFKELAKKHHPDVNPQDAHATQRFIKLNEAYAVMMTCFKSSGATSK